MLGWICFRPTQEITQYGWIPGTAFSSGKLDIFPLLYLIAAAHRFVVIDLNDDVQHHFGTYFFLPAETFREPGKIPFASTLLVHQDYDGSLAFGMVALHLGSDESIADYGDERASRQRYVGER